MISDFRRDLNIVYFLLGISPASNCSWPTFRNPVSVPSSKVGCTLYTQPLKMEVIQGSEMSANYNLTPGKYPKENIQYSNHGESLKSRIRHLYGEDIALYICRLEKLRIKANYNLTPGKYPKENIQNYIHEEINSTVNPENVCCTSKCNWFSFDFQSETLRQKCVEV